MTDNVNSLVHYEACKKTNTLSRIFGHFIFIGEVNRINCKLQVRKMVYYEKQVLNNQLHEKTEE